jgi:hypothetical protein
MKLLREDVTWGRCCHVAHIPSRTTRARGRAQADRPPQTYVSLFGAISLPSAAMRVTPHVDGDSDVTGGYNAVKLGVTHQAERYPR